MTSTYENLPPKSGQPSDGQPVGFDKKPNFEDYALGAFLLAGSEIYRLAE
ncbi:hypothetical protein [Sedimentisphaera salicampi]|nr:hypothetical protein [Sedimentisphaera salicampi]